MDDYQDYGSYYGDYNNYGNSKKNEKEQKEEVGSKVLEIFDSLNQEDIFECMFYLNHGSSISEYLGINMTQDRRDRP